MQETQVRSLAQEQSPGEENDNPLQYSCLGNPMDRGAWWATVHGSQNSQTWQWLNNNTVLFKKNLFIYFNWRIITLQYCDGFCHKLTWISHGYTCVPPSWTSLPLPSPSHPFGLSQCTGFENPVSCIELGLVIYFTYGNIHASMLFSQIIPPLPSPTRVQKSVLYICVSFAFSHIGSSLPSS